MCANAANATNESLWKTNHTNFRLQTDIAGRRLFVDEHSDVKSQFKCFHRLIKGLVKSSLMARIESSSIYLHIWFEDVAQYDIMVPFNIWFIMSVMQEALYVVGKVEMTPRGSVS